MSFFIANNEIQQKNRLLEFFTEFIDENMLSNKYDNLYNAIRNAYSPAVIQGFTVRGVAIWKTKGSEGIGYVAGNVGKDRFFAFDANANKKEGEQRIAVVDAYLESQVQFAEYARVAFTYEYMLCYPLGKDIIISIHIKGPKKVTHEDFAILDQDNSELMITLNYLFGGEPE